MNADGSNVTLVANTEGRATAPQWSKDGRLIYFTNSWRTGQKRRRGNLQGTRTLMKRPCQLPSHRRRLAGWQLLTPKLSITSA